MSTQFCAIDDYVGAPIRQNYRRQLAYSIWGYIDRAREMRTLILGLGKRFDKMEPVTSLDFHLQLGSGNSVDHLVLLPHLLSLTPRRRLLAPLPM